jgi:hypothetical protein
VCDGSSGEFFVSSKILKWLFHEKI